MLGGLAGMSFPGWRDRYLHLLLSLSGAYLLSITALHLMPDAFIGNGTKPGIAVLIGFFLQVVFEQLSSGVEHGHIHVHGGKRVAVPVLIGLSLHALLEGSPLALMQDSFHAGHEHNHLLMGIVLHKIPAAFALCILLLQAGYKKSMIWILLGIFGLMSPIGALLADLFISPEWIPYLLGLVIGSLLHVSTTILFELDDPHHHRLTLVKTLAILTGILLAVGSSYF